MIFKAINGKNTMAYAFGDFSFVEDKDTRVMLDSMCKAVTVTENWNKLADAKSGEGGFMFPSDPAIQRLTAEITKADEFNKYHSGSSFGWTIRQMEFIAKSGWPVFCADYMKHQLQTKIHELRALYEEAELIYRVTYKRCLRQDTPEAMEYYMKIANREKTHCDMALQRLLEAEKTA